MVDGTSYRVVGVTVFPGCSGSGFLPCSGTVIINCLPGTGFSPIGSIRIVGTGVACQQIPQDQIPPVGEEPEVQEICNTTTVTVKILGEAASVTSNKGDTASSLALDLAGRIALHPALFSRLSAVVSGSEITVLAREPGPEVYYPWESSCSYIVDFFDACDFKAELAPAAAMISE
jgi:hypothetical protein